MKSCVFGTLDGTLTLVRLTLSLSSNLQSQLGEGAFSIVKEVTHRSNRSVYAAKVVTKAKLTKEDEDALQDEITILKNINHSNIITLYDVFDENSYYYLVTEIMLGGELFDRIVTKTFYNEKEARDVCKILFEALNHIHSKGIAHRDLKPENLLLVSKTDDKDIKIADFGFAKKVTGSKCLMTQCGTPGYVAPEILHGEYKPINEIVPQETIPGTPRMITCTRTQRVGRL